MKKIYTCFLVLTLGLFISCDDFLDVKSDQELFQDESLEKPEGFHMYVNGIYRLLGEQSLYGRELTWGLVSALGNNYASNSTSYLGNSYYYASKFNWQNSSVQSTMSNIFKQGYHVIANCNNLIQEVTAKDTSFFEYGSIEKAMILGEMYGLRALVHFDLLRLFAPAPVTNPSGLALPYVTVYPEKQPTHITANEVLGLAIEDMKKAKDLLGPVDTGFCYRWYSSVTGRIRRSNTYSTYPPNAFMSYRGMRMNHYAAAGLLARMYMYKNDYKNAYEQAKYVVDAVEDGWFQWTSSSKQYSSNAVNQYPKRFEELMLCFSNNDSYDNWEYFTNAGANYLTMNDTYVKALFKGDEDDYRYKGMYGAEKGRFNANKRWLVWERPVATTSTTTIPVDYTDQGPLLPVLRFTELYHILIECMIVDRNEQEDAIERLNYVRTKRGCKVQIVAGTPREEVLEMLYKDIIRETLTEGQTFFLFKRLNRDIYNGTTSIVMQPENWYAPIPDGESSYL